MPSKRKLKAQAVKLTKTQTRSNAVLRLFAIHDDVVDDIVVGPVASQGVYFEDKISAKRARNTLNEGLSPPRYFVVLGPDHRRYIQP